MKIMIFFLLSIISFAQTMEKESELSKSADSLTTICSLPDEVKLKIFEFCLECDSMQKAISSVYSLSCTCKDFLRFFSDKTLIRRMIDRLENHVQNSAQDSSSKIISKYLILKAIAIRLRTSQAMKWYFHQSGQKESVHDFKRVKSRERMDLKNIMLKCYGGLTVSEYRLIDPRPVKVLEVWQTNEKNVPPVKTLSLRSCNLMNLRGLLYIQDLRTIETFDVCANNIYEIDICAFERFDNLVKLDLSLNNFKQIDLAIFSRLKKLRQLDLSRNQIEKVSYTSNENSPDLAVLDLSFNSISTIESPIIEKISARIIDLKNNPLSDIDSIKQLSKPVTKRILFDE